MIRKIIIIVIVAVIAGLGFMFYNSRSSFLAPKDKSENTQSSLQLMYWVPVTGYFSKKENINLDDLKTTSLIVGESEEKNLADFLGDNKKITLKETKEIQNGLSENEIAIIPFSDVTPNLKTLSVDSKYIWNKKDVTAYPLKKEIMTDGKVEKFDPEKLTKITATGDVILGRTVARKMAELGVLNPWKKVYKRLSASDITFSDLEVPLSDLVKPPYEGMSFVAPKEAVKGLLLAGVDIVALANNHSTNFGVNVFADSMKILYENGIKYCGGGKNLSEAWEPVIIEKNNLKWAFLDYNSIIGAIGAEKNSPGTAEFALKPWSKVDSGEDAGKIEEAVKSAKEKADVVIVEFHWGVEYETKQIESQENLAHRIIDAGADMVIGTHPHAVQGSEIYKGKYITYSLGNFIFDQEWSQGTKEGTVLESYYYKDKNVAANLVPVLISDYNQPRFLSNSDGRSIIERIRSASHGL